MPEALNYVWLPSRERQCELQAEPFNYRLHVAHVCREIGSHKEASALVCWMGEALSVASK